MNRQDLIERLRATEDEQEAAGRRMGKFWAEAEATVAELRRLTKATERGWNGSGAEDSYSDAERLYFVIDPEWDGNRTAARDWWSGMLEAPVEDVAARFVRGFIEGALEVWNGVKDDVHRPGGQG